MIMKQYNKPNYEQEKIELEEVILISFRNSNAVIGQGEVEETW